jgi:hypothetical protein
MKSLPPSVQKSLQQKSHPTPVSGSSLSGATAKNYTLTDVYVKIVNWNPNWLEEQKRLKEAPPVHGQWELNHKTQVFANYADYCRTFYPLMLHELWSSMYKDYVQG